METGAASGQAGQPAEKLRDEKKRTEKPREKKLKFSYMEQKEWDTIEDDIAALEEKISGLEAQMEAAATDYGKLRGLTEEKDEAEARLEEKMERWMYLNELAEKIASQK